MENIVTLAIVGTQQAGEKEIVTGLPVDALSDQLSGDKERKLLLAAGAWSIYCQAGRIAETMADAPEPAQPESLKPCSRELAQIIDKQLVHGNDNRIVLEALQLMKQAGLRLRPEILYSALYAGKKTQELQDALLPVLGERGRWLSQCNPTWAWVTDYMAPGTLPENAETIWQEGARKERRDLLQRLRGLDPAQARDWLQSVWKQERADARADFLGTFRTGLSVEDMHLLEMAHNDNNEAVRVAANLLLLRFPTSDLSLRMQARGDAMMHCAKGKISLTLPEATDKQWGRDGIVAVVQNRVVDSEKQLQVLSHIPPDHWEARFSASPEQLIQAAIKHERAARILEVWSRAAIFYQTSHWAEPLLEWWRIEWKNHQTYSGNAHLEQQLMDLLPQETFEEWIARAVYEEGWIAIGYVFNRSYSREFSETQLHTLRNLARTLKPGKSEYDQRPYLLVDFARSLDPSCFDLALQTWQLPEEDPKFAYILRSWKQEIAHFTEIINLRKSIIEEINS